MWSLGFNKEVSGVPTWEEDKMWRRRRSWGIEELNLYSLYILAIYVLLFYFKKAYIVSIKKKNMFCNCCAKIQFNFIIGVWYRDHLLEKMLLKKHFYLHNSLWIDFKTEQIFTDFLYIEDAVKVEGCVCVCVLICIPECINHKYIWFY